MRIKILFTLLILTTHVLAQDKKEQLNAYFTALSENGQFNGNVLIAENQKIIYEKSFGYANFGRKEKIAADASLPIASITKTFTATAILQLKEKEKLRLDDRVAKFLRDFPYDEVTIKQLLSHTAGLPIYDSLFFSLIPKHPDTVFRNKDLIPAMISKKSPLIFKPGEDFSYNNINYNVLALIIEKITGMPFESYLKQYIFVPSGMTNTSTSIFFKRNDSKLVKRYNHKNIYDDGLQLVDTASEFKIIYRFNCQGHGDLISTTHDLLKYDLALSNGTLLNDETLKEAFTPVKLTNGKDNIQRYALGWITREDQSLGEIVNHDGGLPGGRSILLRNLTRHQTIVLYDNTANNVIPIADKALRILNGETVEKPKKSASNDYGIALAKSGSIVAGKLMARMKKDTIHYYVNEDELNTLGYAFLAAKRNMEAEAAFKLNTELFSSSWNAYDSYGEILLQIGKKEQAIKMYQKSLSLNPANENGRKILEQQK